MMQFFCIIELFEEEQVKYMTVPFQGGSMSLPEKENMQDRDDIVEKVKEAYPNKTILDLVGIVYEGETIWQD